MIPKLLLLVALLFIACFIAAFLVDRLRQNVQQLAALKKDLARTDEKLRAHLQAMEAQQVGERRTREPRTHVTVPLENLSENTKEH